MSKDDTFLRRWARRKHDATQEAEAAAPPEEPLISQPLPESPADPTALPQDCTPAQPGIDSPESEGPESEGPESEGPESESDSATDVDPEAALPPIESLVYESDYSGFMVEGVSEALRRQALRKLWRSNPVLANVDGLNDYDGDFTDAALVKDNLKTAFDAIRGYARDEPPPEDPATGDEDAVSAEIASEDVPEEIAESNEVAEEAPKEISDGTLAEQSAAQDIVQPADEKCDDDLDGTLSRSKSDEQKT